MYNAEETKELRSRIALELARHKLLVKMGKDHPVMLNDEDINEVFVVAGLPLLTPSELEAPEVQVIKMSKEDYE